MTAAHASKAAGLLLRLPLVALDAGDALSERVEAELALAPEPGDVPLLESEEFGSPAADAPAAAGLAGHPASLVAGLSPPCSCAAMVSRHVIAGGPDKGMHLVPRSGRYCSWRMCACGRGQQKPKFAESRFPGADFVQSTSRAVFCTWCRGTT